MYQWAEDTSEISAVYCLWTSVITYHHIEIVYFIVYFRSLNLAISLSDNSIEIYKLSDSSLHQVCRLHGHKEATLTQVVFSPKEDNLLYSTGLDGLVKLWDIRAGGSCVLEYKGMVQ